MSKSFEELVAEAMPAEGEYIEFDGMNCNEYDEDADCIGWDGRDRRCSCGNRRVYWTLSEDGLYVYAMAD